MKFSLKSWSHIDPILNNTRVAHMKRRTWHGLTDNNNISYMEFYLLALTAYCNAVFNVYDFATYIGQLDE